MRDALAGWNQVFGVCMGRSGEGLSLKHLLHKLCTGRQRVVWATAACCTENKGLLITSSSVTRESQESSLQAASFWWPVVQRLLLASWCAAQHPSTSIQHVVASLPCRAGPSKHGDTKCILKTGCYVIWYRFVSRFVTVSHQVTAIYTITPYIQRPTHKLGWRSDSVGNLNNSRG